MDAAALRSLPLFEGLADDVVDRCAELFQETEMLAGSGLTREGDFAYKFFVVLEGEVAVLKDFERVATLGAGDFFGETGILTGERRNARVVAETRCRLAWMMGWDFTTMTEEFPAVASRISAVLGERSAEG